MTENVSRFELLLYDEMPERLGKGELYDRSQAYIFEMSLEMIPRIGEALPVARRENPKVYRVFEVATELPIFEEDLAPEHRGSVRVRTLSGGGRSSFDYDRKAVVYAVRES